MVRHRHPVTHARRDAGRRRRIIGMIALVLLAGTHAPAAVAGERHFLAGPQHQVPTAQRPAATATGPTEDERGAFFREAMAALDLTADQRDRLRGALPRLMRAGQEARSRHQAQVEEVQRHMQKARDTGDAEAMRAVLKQRAALMSGAPIRKVLRRELGSILTDAQMKQLETQVEHRLRKALKSSRGAGARGQARGATSRPAAGPAANRLDL